MIPRGTGGKTSHAAVYWRSAARCCSCRLAQRSKSRYPFRRIRIIPRKIIYVIVGKMVQRRMLRHPIFAPQ
ncbi:hypothetical protein KCP73_09785 [Salmonella enterica subsp. enterica]|nr:hypothetical protein KCP73_09785 [Salmonella enterica subsp. enterica]